MGAIVAALRANGVTRGDRVCGYLPNSSLAVEAMLATASIGAVWSSTSPDFGVTVSGITCTYMYNVQCSAVHFAVNLLVLFKKRWIHLQ